MVRTFEQKRHQQITARLNILGTFLFILAVLVMAFGIVQHENTSATAAASYTARQEAHARVKYFENSFFGTSPRLTSNAYISDLTDTVVAKFNSTYAMTRSLDLAYSYRVDAALRGIYPVEGDKENVSSVWQKDYVLVDNQKFSEHTNSVSISQEVEVPFAEYKAALEDFKKTLNVPVEGEAVVTMAIEISGYVDGAEFRDNQNIVMTLPLTKDIYQPDYKYDKERKGAVSSDEQSLSQSVVQKIMLALVVLLAASGISSVVYAQRAKIFKSPYRRELDRIYRYHGDTIVRASRHPDVLHKTVVDLQRFEDILNLEEELRSPIIASESGDTATRFMIIKGDVVYVFVLGVLPADDADVLHELEQAFTKKPTASKEPSKTKAKKPRLIQQ